MKRKELLMHERAELLAESKGFFDQAEKEARDLTEAESARADEITTRVDAIDLGLAQRAALEAQMRSAPATPAADAGSAPLQATPGLQVHPNEHMEKRGGFATLAEFANAVRGVSGKGSAHVPNAKLDEMVAFQRKAAPTSYGNEGVGAEGGYLVPEEFSMAVTEAVMAEDDLFARTDQLPISGNKISMPTDENTPWGTTGVQAYWEGEAGQFTQSKPDLDLNEYNARKLTALVPMTDELLEDAPASDAYIRKAAGRAISFKLADAIVNGTGVGSPLGFMNSGALITAAKEAAQTADTVVAGNINKMYMRMPFSNRGGAIWLANQDLEEQLEKLHVAGTNSDHFLYVPPGGIADAPYGRLKGRPVIFHQSMQTLGDLGDIALVDLSAYQTVVKRGGVRTDISIHLWFDYDVTAYRFIVRVGGHPKLSAPISPKNGSNTLSPFVTLEARA